MFGTFWQGELEPFGPVPVALMSSPSWNTAAYWRELAIEMRKLADDVKDAGTRAVMLRAADEYDKRTEQAESRERSK